MVHDPRVSGPCFTARRVDLFGKDCDERDGVRTRRARLPHCQLPLRATGKWQYWPANDIGRRCGPENSTGRKTPPNSGSFRSPEDRARDAQEAARALERRATRWWRPLCPRPSGAVYTPGDLPRSLPRRRRGLRGREHYGDDRGCGRDGLPLRGVVLPAQALAKRAYIAMAHSSARRLISAASVSCRDLPDRCRRGRHHGRDGARGQLVHGVDHTLPTRSAMRRAPIST
jgi:hypothetical protein